MPIRMYRVSQVSETRDSLEEDGPSSWKSMQDFCAYMDNFCQRTHLQVIFFDSKSAQAYNKRFAATSPSYIPEALTPFAYKAWSCACGLKREKRKKKPVQDGAVQKRGREPCRYKITARWNPSVSKITCRVNLHTGADARSNGHNHALDVETYEIARREKMVRGARNANLGARNDANGLNRAQRNGRHRPPVRNEESNDWENVDRYNDDSELVLQDNNTHGGTAQHDGANGTMLGEVHTVVNNNANVAMMHAPHIGRAPNLREVNNVSGDNHHIQRSDRNRSRGNRSDGDEIRVASLMKYNTSRAVKIASQWSHEKVKSFCQNVMEEVSDVLSNRELCSTQDMINALNFMQSYTLALERGKEQNLEFQPL